MSSVMWTSLLAGKDAEGIEIVNEQDKKVFVNTAEYGYENAVNMIVKALSECNLTPKDMILVFEGTDSKARRKMIFAGYKGSDHRVPEQYIQFNKLKDKLADTFANLGAIAAVQDFVEGDDVIAYLALNAEEDCVVLTGDNDLAVLNGVNEYGANVQVRIGGEYGKNKYGDFDFKLITLYKATVGDSSDKIPGAKGFGPTAFLNVNSRYDDDGCFELLSLISEGKRDALAKIADDNKCKYLQKVVDEWENVYMSYRLALLHPEWVNAVRQPLQWFPGMVTDKVRDERLVKWASQSRLVTADNYDKAFAFFKSKIAETEEFTIDFETSTSEDSDDWLEARGKKGVDVISSYIVSMGINFGKNNQYGYYLSVKHWDTDNCTMDQLRELLEAIPKDKFIVAHNAAGFELPVAYNAFGKVWADNGWRGFIPNMVDTRIAATFWDENQPSHGLKALTKLLFNYDQTSYETVTTKSGPVGTLTNGVIKNTYELDDKPFESRTYKMHQLTAKEVLSYGLDDVYTAAGLWNFFKLIMQTEHTYEAYCRLEQKPMYLSAMAYVKGVDVDIPRLSGLKSADEELQKKSWATIVEFLIEKEWDGVTCPVYEKLDAPSIKEATNIILGTPLVTAVRTPAKLATLIGLMDGGEVLAKLVAEDRVDLVNQMVAKNFTGAPIFNVGSPNQIANLLYTVIGIPVRLRNKVTDAARARGERQGTPRTDDDAINMAIKMEDVTEREADVLKALLTMKSCNTRNSLYWSAIPLHIHWDTGRLHSEIIQSSTNTRRWTSSKINLQQLESKADGVRSTIKDKDRVVISLDQTSQEVRLMAELSKDENLLSCYVGENLRDTHSLVAHRIAGVTYEEFMVMRKSEDKAVKEKANDIRQVAKQVFFGFLFGAAAPKLSETLGISVEDAQGYIDAINTAFPGIRTYQDESSAMAEKLGYVPIIGGTKRHLAKLVTSENKWEASKALRQAGNARIQGGAANQIKTVMTDLWDSDLIETTSFNWMFVVHDEVVISADKKDAAKVTKAVHEAMTKDFLSLLPSQSSIGIGKNFGQLIELEKPLEALGVDFDYDLVQDTVDSLTKEIV